MLWYLAMWVDQNLIPSMYPGGNVFLPIFANPGEYDAKRMLMNMITTSFYLGLSLLWSGVMVWIWMNIGRLIIAATSPLARPADIDLYENLLAEKVRTFTVIVVGIE